MKATFIVTIVVVVLLFGWINSPHMPAPEVVIPSEDVAVMKSPSKETTLPKVQTMQLSYSLQDAYNAGHLHVEEKNALFRFEDLQLYPVFASQAFIMYHKRLGPYRSLREAMDKKDIVITEILADESLTEDTTREQSGEDEAALVNTLLIENISSDTIIILGGEVIRGGKQDRMIAEDFMVVPHSGKLDIAVFCVEHGRWTQSEKGAFFQVAMDIAPNKVRKAKSAPAAQEEVWDEVADIAADLDVRESTGALAEALADEDMQTSVKPYKEHLEKIRWPENVVGVVAVMGNQIVGCDIFAQHALFEEYYPSLLSSYCSDAYEPDNIPALSYGQVQSFFQTLIGREGAVDAYIEKQGTQLKNGRYRIHVSVY